MSQLNSHGRRMLRTGTVKPHPGHSIVLLILASFLVCQHVDCQYSAARVVDVAKQLCSDEAVEISGVPQVKSLIEYLNTASGSAECDTSKREAILNLSSLIEKIDDVCSKEMLSKLGEFRVNFMLTNHRLWTSLPKSLQMFVVGFGLRINRACKLYMVKRLVFDSHSALEKGDFNLLGSLTDRKDGVLAKLSIKPEDIDLTLLARTATQKKVHIQTRPGTLINQIKLYCQKRYKPVYDEFMTPIIELTNIGFNYQSKPLKERTLSLGEIGLWYQLVYLCELLDSVEIIEDNLGSPFKVLTEEEASKLRASVSPQPSHGDDIQLVTIQHKPTKVDPVIMDYQDKSFMALVNGFDKQQSPSLFYELKSQLFKGFN